MKFQPPVTRRRMGRPAMNLEETNVRLNAGSKKRIASLVGENRMSAFIREAVEEKLKREEKAAAAAHKRPLPETP